MLISLADFPRYAREEMLPSEPTSLYRYIEHLIEIVVARKYGPRDAVEIGPGLDPIFKYLRRSDVRSATVVDYSRTVIDECRRLCADKNLEGIEADVDAPGVLEKLGRRWDYVISNGVVEHLRNDVDHVRDILRVMPDGGFFVCTTVLHQGLFNEWDHAVGHYRRYSVESLRRLFRGFSEVQIVQTSLLQELVRPLFFGRIRHLLSSTVEENNRNFVENVRGFSKPPYAGAFRLIRPLFPLYLLIDWIPHDYLGAIVIVVARK